MTKMNREVSENTENIAGVIVVVKTTESSTRFYTKSSCGKLTQIKKKDYFDMLEKQSSKEMSTAKTIREVNNSYRSMGDSDMKPEERSKVDWYYWNQDNNLSSEKAKRILGMIEDRDIIKIPDYIDEAEDIVNVGGWLYNHNGVIGFISNHLKSKGNLDITLYNKDESMQYWDQLKSEYIVNKFKFIPLLAETIGSDLVSTYYVVPELNDEQQFDIAVGNKTEDDFSSMVQVYREDILGIDCLVHLMLGDNNNNRVYFVEELEDKQEQDEVSEEEL